MTTMNGFGEILFLDAMAQAEKIRQKEFQPAELLEAAVECIKHLNPALNAVVTPMYEQARAAISAGLPTGPFTGVPFLLKDLLASYAGVRLTSVSKLLRNFFTDYDLLLTPTLAEPPVPLGTFDPPPADPLRATTRAGEFVPFTQLANITGQPAMSLPLAWNKDGLPIGTHFMGRFGDEATLFRLAAQLEMARPWRNCHPGVSVWGEK